MGGIPTPQAAKAVAEALSPRVNFVMVWVGEKYGPEYPAILQDQVMRNASACERECAFFCITDRPDELPEGVYPIPAPEGLPGWWAKLALFSPAMPWTTGDRCVYFDLDVAITGPLEDLVETPGIIADWHWPCYNSSVMVWSHGDHRDIWDAYRSDPKLIDAPACEDLAPLLPAGQINGGDQELLTRLGGWQTFPAEWFCSYRDPAVQDWPPTNCKAVVFHGNPKPSDIDTGWVPNVWKVGGLTSFPVVKGVNTSVDQRMANVRSAVLRDLPWFTGFRDEGRTCAIVCGAPSMKDCLPDIKAQKRRGAQIVSVNNAWRFLVANGITPDVHVMLDARPENAEFVRGAPKSMRFVLASQCHPDLFDALDGYEVSIWHNGFDKNTELLEILEPYWEPGPNQKPCILVPGGSTVGLRCLWLATYSGFRTLHVYGMDSSYADDGSHHAYAQTLNDQESILEVVRGEKKYLCAPWMVRAAREFGETWHDLVNYVDWDGKPAPVTVHVHGTGLIPDIARDLREEARAAA